tara:strand:+ start:2398 stop:2847 length:450 start_codon:yes stop_codon:yes gene_type:complete
MIKIVFLSLAVFLLSCGPKYIKDPNANVLLTSQYEDEPPKIIFLKSEPCKRQLDCTKKSKAECAAALFNDSKKIIKKAEELEDKKLYLSAKVEYMIAMCRLVEAEILISQVKTEDYEDFVAVTTLGLEKAVKKKINLCEKKILILNFKR